MARLRITSLCLALALLWGCGGGTSATGPSGPDLRGTWVYNNRVSDATYVCMVLNIPLTISQQNGSAFSGTYLGGSRICRWAGGAQAETIGNFSGTVVNGMVSDTAVAFDIDASSYHNTGTVTGNAMGGLIDWYLPLNGAPHYLTGTWTAVKH